ncbi:MAG: transketolase-like TK C-terminal-containing protein, partial [Planctomycetota bacterium]
TDEELRHLRRGRHEFRKVYAAYAAAQAEPDRPTVILAKTVKGWTLGEGAMGRNIAHQAKKLGMEELRAFRDLLELDIADDQLKDPPIIELPIESDEVRYLRGRRAALGGGVPRRVVKSFPLEVPDRSVFARFFKGSGDQEVSTTGAFARMLALLLDDKGIGKRVVPIIPDEARTFGLNALFRKFGIYSSVGQLYTPVDAATYLYYRESKDGQVLQEGICEAGAMASFMAAGTSYSTHGQPMLPIYIFYSMFGYQRIGDQAWAFGDARGRGFLIGATAGRTTLNGEGLQHQDGHSILIASTNPTCMVYDPSFAYEIAVIIQEGLRRMLHEEEDVYYYVTVENEAYPMPAMPEGAAEGILKGLYQLSEAEAPKGTPRVQLMGCGSILNEVIRAREILAGFGVAADLWSATSYTELRRDALRCERWNRFHPGQEARVPYVTATLAGAEGPVIAASDYMKLVADQIGQFVPNDFVALGTDGFGRSDTREALREHFEVSAEIIAFTALSRLAHAGTIDIALVQDALTKLEIDADKPDPAHA